MRDKNLNAELISFTTGNLGVLTDKAYQARLIATDLVLAHESARTWLPTSELEKCRRAISSWNYEVAAQLAQNGLSTSTHAEEVGEWNVENARVAFHLGNFQDTIRFATSAIEISPHPPTRISAYILRGNSSLEVGSLEQCRMDIRTCEGILRLYPAHPGVNYLETLRVRLSMRDSSPLVAESLLRQFESRLHFGEQLDLDALHVYLRVKNDLFRISGKMDLATSLACVDVAAAIGDELYRGLDLIDLWVALNRPTDSALYFELLHLCEKHPRVRLLLEEVEGFSDSVPRTTTGQAMKIASAPTVTAKQSQCPGNSKKVLCLSGAWVADLKTRTFSSFLGFPTAIEIAAAFRFGSTVQKEDLFARIHPGIEFNKLDHDAIVRNGLSRFRKITGISLSTQNGQVVIEDGVLLIP